MNSKETNSLTNIKILFNLEKKYAIVIPVILYRGEAGVIRETKITGRMPEVCAWHTPGGLPVFILQENQVLFIQKQIFRKAGMQKLTGIKRELR